MRDAPSEYIILSKESFSRGKEFSPVNQSQQVISLNE